VIDIPKLNLPSAYDTKHQPKPTQEPLPQDKINSNPRLDSDHSYPTYSNRTSYKKASKLWLYSILLQILSVLNLFLIYVHAQAELLSSYLGGTILLLTISFTLICFFKSFEGWYVFNLIFLVINLILFIIYLPFSMVVYYWIIGVTSSLVMIGLICLLMGLLEDHLTPATFIPKLSTFLTVSLFIILVGLELEIIFIC
jgi:hypothetical protein